MRWEVDTPSVRCSIEIILPHCCRLSQCTTWPTAFGRMRNYGGTSGLRCTEALSYRPEAPRLATSSIPRRLMDFDVDKNTSTPPPGDTLLGIFFVVGANYVYSNWNALAEQIIRSTHVIKRGPRRARANQLETDISQSRPGHVGLARPACTNNQTLFRGGALGDGDSSGVA